MRWLVAADTRTDLDEIETRLRNMGCTDIDVDQAVPLDNDEISVPVDGPTNLDTLVEDDPVLIAAYNDSPQSPY